MVNWMAWIQLALYTSTDQAERLGDMLNAIDAVAVTLSDGANEEIFEPPPGEMPLWQTTKVIGLFDDSHSAESILQRLKVALDPYPIPQYEFSRLEDQDWERTWLDEFKPMQFGARVWVVPTVYEPVDKAAVNIRLDPGLAFGTGTHPTTALCLSWLDRQELEDKRVVDFGCGSGILGIAAAMLGAEHVWAVDIDPQAVQATKSNAELNGVSDNLTIGLVQELKLPQVDVLVANILANPLKGLAKNFSSLLKSGDQIALSGILSEQAEGVKEAYEAEFTDLALERRDDWVLITGKRR